MPTQSTVHEPAVSIVLPVYNGAATLGDALESIHAQTLQHWELVLVDDRSTDGSAALARARMRAAQLERHGQRIAGYIDIDPTKQGRVRQGRRVVGPGVIPPPAACVEAGYVAKRGAHLIARTALRKRGFVEGEDFWLAA